jgi:hypothetical protein
VPTRFLFLIIQEKQSGRESDEKMDFFRIGFFGSLRVRWEFELAKASKHSRADQARLGKIVERAYWQENTSPSSPVEPSLCGLTIGFFAPRLGGVYSKV